MVTSHGPNNFDFDPPNGEAKPVSDHQAGLDSFPASGPMDSRKRSLYREFCLGRLSDLLQARAQLLSVDDPERALHRSLIDRSLYSAYRDCVGAGVETQARQLLDAVAGKS